MYQIEQFDDKIKIKISASYEFMEKLCLAVEKFSKEKKFHKKNFAIQLCVREALTNAIRHGCKNDSSKLIRFEMVHENNGMNFFIEDEGDGFDWHKVTSDNIEKLKSHGRGRNIIKIYSNEVFYSEKGNKINFVIKNE